MGNTAIKNKPDIKNILLNDKFIIGFLSLTVFIVCLWHIPQRTSIYLTADEFSNYGIAAYLYGFDWSGFFEFDYNQFGYALIFIFPFFLIFGDNMLAIYHATLVCNALIATSIVPLSYYILRQWGVSSLKENKIYIPVILVVSLAACTVSYSNLGISDVLLIATGFAITAMILKMQKMVNAKKIKARYLIIFTLALLIFIIIKTVFSFNISSLNNLAAFVRVTIAQLWYLGIASFLLVYLGIFYLAKECGLYTISLIKRKTVADIDFSLIFIFLSFISALITSSSGTYFYGDSVNAPYFDNADGFFYGRDNALMFLPVSLYALKTIIEKSKNYNWKSIIPYAAAVLIFFAQSLWVSSFYEHNLAGKHIEYANVINYVLFDSIIIGGVAVIAVFAFLSFEVLFKKRDYILTLLLLFIVFINIYAGYSFITGSAIAENNRTIGINELKDLRGFDEVYFYSDDNCAKMKTQMALPATRIIAPSRLSDIQNPVESKLILKRENLGTALIENRINLNKYEIRKDLVIVSDFTKEVNIITLPMIIFLVNYEVYDDYSVTLEGDAGALIQDFNIVINPGSYIFSLQLTLFDSGEKHDDLGSAEIVFTSLEQESIRKILSKDDFDKDGNFILDMEITLEEAVSDFEFRVLTEEDVILHISGIYVKVLS